jgi:hypothetical protein
MGAASVPSLLRPISGAFINSTGRDQDVGGRAPSRRSRCRPPQVATGSRFSITGAPAYPAASGDVHNCHRCARERHVERHFVVLSGASACDCRAPERHAN